MSETKNRIRITVYKNSARIGSATLMLKSNIDL